MGEGGGHPPPPPPTPAIVMLLSIKPSKPRLVHDQQYLICFMQQCPFSLDQVVNLPRYLSQNSFQTKMDDKSGFDHFLISKGSQPLMSVEWGDIFSTVILASHSSYSLSPLGVAMRLSQLPIGSFYLFKMLFSVCSLSLACDLSTLNCFCFGCFRFGRVCLLPETRRRKTQALLGLWSEMNRRWSTRFFQCSKHL